MFNFFRQGRSYARSPEVVPLVVREEGRQHRICRFAGPNEEEFEKLPRFGPLYSKDESEIWRSYKDEAWVHVLVKTEGDGSETTENYLSAIGEVERDAVDCYADVTMVESETEFRWMMLKDGCFLIQLVLLILGGSSVLDYPRDHLIFGRSERKDMKRWLRSLFYVGNQIPLVVLWKLMEQPFFQELLAKREWEEPSDFLERVLYELLIVPYTQKGNSSGLMAFPTALQGPIFAKRSQLPIERSSDLLHSLHSFVIGTRKKAIVAKADLTKGKKKARAEDKDLELGDIEDLVDDKEFRRATKLSKAGIGFKNAEKGMGCGGIYLDRGVSSSVVFMPTLAVEDNTELMFQCLKLYEWTQETNKRKREVCGYLKFMSELIQTPEDVKFLASQGIIKGDPVYKEKLPQILSRLADFETSENLWRLRVQINDYSRPAWLKYKGILSTAIVLTFLQTVFTILSYTRDVKP